MEKRQVRITKLDERAQTPTYGTCFSAGADLYALLEEDITIDSGETVLVHTGIAMEIPEGLVGLIYARSGMATKRGLAPANCVGVIDSDYRGEIHVGLHNLSQEAYTIAPLERIAQMIIMPYFAVDVIEAEALDETDRGAGGFGSTGTK